MTFIKAKIRKKIYEGSGGFKISLAKILETDEEELNKKIGKLITVTGIFSELFIDDTYIFYGKYIYKDKYGYQYAADDYSKVEPDTLDSIFDFLTSSLIKGCGEKTAQAIIDTFGVDSLKLIKEDFNNLFLVPGMTKNKALKIFDSLIMVSATDDLIIDLKELGFSIKESTLIVERYGFDSFKYINNNIYDLKDLIDFSKLDKIYLKKIGSNIDLIRVKETILYNLNLFTYNSGNTYLVEEELYYNIFKWFKNEITYEEITEALNELVLEEKIVVVEDKFYLKEYYEVEDYSSLKIKKILNNNIINYDYSFLLEDLEIKNKIKYNEYQKSAICGALNNSVSIISGGPGTGKTTIVNAIVKLYMTKNNLKFCDVGTNIALLAPTGRASKKLSCATGIGAMTIHRYLKWNKESNKFLVDEDNKNFHKLIIVDETSMIDVILFDALMKGIVDNIQIVFVGDANQLPSVGPGNVLNDLIDSKKISYFELEKIYRQSDNSYIPVLAEEIKDKYLSNYTEKKDDYNFLSTRTAQIAETIKKIVIRSKAKGINEHSLQVLVPIYGGPVGIDRLNVLLQDVYNPKENQNEIVFSDVTFREKDKIIQLVNNIDLNIFNGDIGVIVKIDNSKKSKIVIDFDGNIIEYEKEDLINIKHAYAMTIHKAQGSDFEHVILPISKAYHKMLYNKLLYTAVSRAKKSLVVLGDVQAFYDATMNDYSENRNTSLYDNLLK